MADSHTKREQKRRIKLPIVSILIASAAIAFYTIYGPAHRYQYSFGLAPEVNFLLHPLIHISEGHLIGNVIFGILIIGPLVEVWMTRLSLKSRYAIMSFGYLLGLGIELIIVYLSGWNWNAVSVGASGLVASWLGFCVAYYSSFYRKLRLSDKLNAFAPIAIGMGLTFLIAQLPAGEKIGYVTPIATPFLHFYFLLPSLAIGFLLFRKFRVGTSKP